jgi:VanZ family protein
VIGRYAPPLALMALIWFLSAQPDLKSGLDSDLDLVLRKLAHMTEFGLLLVLWWRAAGPRAAVAITLAWAALDEWHQTWVEGRNGAVTDWLIDASGAAIAAALTVWWLRRRAGAGRGRRAGPAGPSSPTRRRGRTGPT